MYLDLFHVYADLFGIHHAVGRRTATLYRPRVRKPCGNHQGVFFRRNCQHARRRDGLGFFPDSGEAYCRHAGRLEQARADICGSAGNSGYAAVYLCQRDLRAGGEQGKSGEGFAAADLLHAEKESLYMGCRRDRRRGSVHHGHECGGLLFPVYCRRYRRIQQAAGDDDRDACSHVCLSEDYPEEKRRTACRHVQHARNLRLYCQLLRRERHGNADGRLLCDRACPASGLISSVSDADGVCRLQRIHGTAENGFHFRGCDELSDEGNECGRRRTPRPSAAGIRFYRHKIGRDSGAAGKRAYDDPPAVQRNPCPGAARDDFRREAF